MEAGMQQLAWQPLPGVTDDPQGEAVHQGGGYKSAYYTGMPC